MDSALRLRRYRGMRRRAARILPFTRTWTRLTARIAELENTVQEIRAIKQAVPGSKVLDGFKEIGAFTGIPERTLRRYAIRRRDPLPMEGSRDRRWSYAAAVIAWMRRNDLPMPAT